MNKLTATLLLLASLAFSAPGDTVAIDTTAPVYKRITATGKYLYTYDKIHPGSGGSGTGDSSRAASIADSTKAVPIASTTQRGGVKQGANTTVSADGTISVGAPYTLPVATPSVLGGVRQGSGVTIAGDGTLSAAGLYTSRLDTLSALQQITGAGLRCAVFGSSSSAGITNWPRAPLDHVSQTIVTENHVTYWYGAQTQNHSPFYLQYLGAQGGYTTNQIYNTFLVQDSSYIFPFVDIAVLQLGANDVGNSADISAMRAYVDTFIYAFLNARKKVILVVPHCTRIETTFTGYDAYQAYCDSMAKINPGRVFVASHYLRFGSHTITPDRYLDGTGVHLNASGSIYVGPAWSSAIRGICGIVPLRRAKEFGKVVARITGSQYSSKNSTNTFWGFDTLGDSTWTVTSNAGNFLGVMTRTVAASQLIPGRRYRLYGRYWVDSIVYDAGAYQVGGGMQFSADGSSTTGLSIASGPAADTLPTHTYLTVLSHPWIANRTTTSYTMSFTVGWGNSKYRLSEVALIELPDSTEQKTIASSRFMDSIPAATVKDIAHLPGVRGRTTLAQYELGGYGRVKISFDLFDTTATAIDSISVFFGANRIYTTGSYGSGIMNHHHEITVTPALDAGQLIIHRESILDGTVSSARANYPYAYAQWRLVNPINVFVRSAGALTVTNFKIESIR